LSESAPQRITWLGLCGEKVDTRELIQVYFFRFRLVRRLCVWRTQEKLLTVSENGKRKILSGLFLHFTKISFVPQTTKKISFMLSLSLQSFVPKVQNFVSCIPNTSIAHYTHVPRLESKSLKICVHEFRIRTKGRMRSSPKLAWNIKAQV
jgi:hypothetical protein